MDKWFDYICPENSKLILEFKNILKTPSKQTSF